MPSPLQAAGAVSAPSKYAPLHVNEFFTGLWTQRNPLREAAVPQIYQKFYAASRFDSLIGGLNAEISAMLTPIKRPGFSIYNSQNFPAITNYYPFKHQGIAGVPQIQVIIDTIAAVYDGTGPNTKNAIYTKSAGDSRFYFQGVLNNLYMGPSTFGGLLYPTTPSRWSAGAVLTAGFWIIDTNGNIQKVTTTGTTGGAPPAWNVAPFATTADNTAVWTCYGPAANIWGLYQAGPAPVVTPAAGSGLQFWVAATAVAHWFKIISSLGYLQYVSTAGNTNAVAEPNWPQQTAVTTNDGTAVWTCAGLKGAWTSATAYQNVTWFVDPNGNIQVLTAGFGGASGAAMPVWSAVVGNNTVDGALTWTCLGTAAQCTFKSVSYAFSWHCSFTGETGPMSPATTLGPVLGAPAPNFVVTGAANTIATAGGSKTDQIRIWRTSDGGSSYLLVATIANPGAGTWTYTDTTLDRNLNVLIQADQVGDNAPPPGGMGMLAFHRGRIFGASGTTVYYCRAASAVDGSPYSCFPGGNYFVFPDVVVRLWPTAIGLVVFTTSNSYLIEGKGTTADPFDAGDYLGGIGLASYDAFGFHGSTAYLMQSNRRVISLDPGAGVVEIGFPIGDQFAAANQFLPNSGTGVDVTWYEGAPGDCALFVADGQNAKGWFRMSATSAPESGLLWSPFGQLAGAPNFSRMRSVETTPGIKQLLVGPAANGPILARDTSAAQDNGANYVWNLIIGSIMLAQPGQVADVDFITLDSRRVGTRPTVGLLLDEISGPFETLNWTSVDPPLLPRSNTLYNDRYVASQSQQHTLCRHLQLRMDWIAENVRHELLSYTIFGAIRQEKRTT